MFQSQTHHSTLLPQERLDRLLNSQWESELLSQLPLPEREVSSPFSSS